MARKMARTRRGRSPDGVNKSEAIREYFRKNPEAGPKEVASALAQAGIDVSGALVSNIKYGTGSGKKRRKKRRGKRKGAGRAAAAGRPANDNVSLSLLMEAKKMANQLGGVEKAKRALDALARLS